MANNYITKSTLIKAILLTLITYNINAITEEETDDFGYVIGIDLGTTYSCVGIYQNGRTEIIANENGNKITPSYVAFINKQVIIGDKAKAQAHVNPAKTIFDAKRIIGLNYSEKSVASDIKN